MISVQIGRFVCMPLRMALIEKLSFNHWFSLLIIGAVVI